MKTKTTLCKAFSVGALIVLASCCNHPFECQVLSYDGNKVAETFLFDGNNLKEDKAGEWTVDVDKTRISDEAVDYRLTFSMKEGGMSSAGVAVQFDFDNWSADNYIFAPSHLYNGNKFKILPIGYAPFIHNEEDRGPDMPVTTTNVPHFAKDGSDSFVDFKTNSCSTPLAGFYDKKAKRGFFILEEQDTLLGNDAFFINEYPSRNRLTIRLSAPGVREHHYMMCNFSHPSDDKGIQINSGDQIKMHFRVYDFPCEDLMSYFDKFFTIRKDISGQNVFRNLEPFSSVAETAYKHHFKSKWYEKGDFAYYCNNPEHFSPFNHLQLGWNGAPVFTLSQMLRPECQQDYDEILRRIGRNFDAIEYMQGKSGLFYGIMKEGELIGDGFNDSRNVRDVAMIRRSALTIYYGLQTFDILRMQGHGDMIKPSWEECLRKASDALVTLFNRHGQFGQFIHAESGDIYIYNSAQGALCMAALAYASRYFGNPEYLALAEKASDYYYENFLAKGYVGGGPAEILQAPDSESSAELVESYMAMFEITRENKWLEYARDAAALFSTWVVSYDFKFPEGSGMNRMNVKATGSVWASVQNEHSAPGLYIMSADFLMKLYRSTGDRRYLDLCRDMAHNVLQYVNTEGNRMQAHGGYGYCTERVNVGDWENDSGCLADNDSNFAWECVFLFETTQNPGIYVQSDKGEITVFDHVNAKIVGSDSSSVTLEIENPTYRDGDISVLVETSDYARENSLGWNTYYNWPKVHVPSGETVTVTLPVAGR